MKRTKTLLCLLLAVVMTLALSTASFAAAQTYTITVKNSNDSISMVGNTYSAYKLFNVTYSGKDAYAYTVTDDFADFEYSYDTTENEQKVTKTVKGESLINYLESLAEDSDALDTFAEAALEYATNKKIAAAGSVDATDANTATISVPTAGYYLVAGSATSTADKNQSVVAACALTTTDPTAEVTVKADVPSIDKNIVKDNGKVKANTASIGDKVEYKIDTAVPNMKGYEKYYFVIDDTMSKGLTYNGDLTVKLGDSTLTVDDYTVTSNVNNDGTTSLKVVFKNFIQYKAQTGIAITVTYSATINQDANLSATKGNTNDVTLTYSNNPNDSGTGDSDTPGEGDATGKTPTSETKTYVTGIQISKVDGQDTTKLLAGAKFQITGTSQKIVLTNKEMYKAIEGEPAEGTKVYYMLKDGTYTDVAADTNKSSDNYNADKYDSTTQRYEKVSVVTKDTVATEINTVGYTNAQGVLTFEGLSTGTYTITELVAPNGYNLLKDPVTIEITDKATLTNANWTVKNGDNVLVANDDNHFVVQVKNNKGTELPSTGGIGTTLFYVIGGLLVVAAGIILVTKKRVSKQEN